MELRDYLRVIQDRKWIIIQAVVVIVAAAIIASLFQRPVYEAQATVWIREQTLGTTLFEGLLPGLSSQPERSLQTQVELIKLRPMAVAVIKKLALDITPEELLSKVSVEPKGQTDIILIRVQDENPKLARDEANALAAEYAKWRRESMLKELRSARKEISDKLKDTEEKLVVLSEKVTAQPADKTASAKLALQLDMASQFYAMLGEKHEQLRITEAMEKAGAEVVAPAVTPSGSVRPKPAQNGMIALLASLVVGLGLAFMVEHLDNTIKTAEDAKKYFGLPLLGQIPREQKAAGNPKPRKTVSHGYSKSCGAEAYRALRTNIQYLNFDKPTASIVVTSGSAGEGKTTILSNLATTLAQAGSKVIVLNGDLRQPAMRGLFWGGNREGLSSVLAGKASFEQALQDTDVDGLKILPNGPLPPNPSELLGSQRMEKVLEQAKKMADIVLIDTPPVLAVTDSVVVAPKTDGVILVAGAGQTTREAVKQTKERLESVDARLLGAVLNKVTPRKGYGYYYHYYYHYSDEESKRKRSRKRLVPTLMGSAGIVVTVGVVVYIVDSYLGLGIFSVLANLVRFFGR